MVIPKVYCEVCGNGDWWKFDLIEGKHICLCCKGKKELDAKKNCNSGRAFEDERVSKSSD